MHIRGCCNGSMQEDVEFPALLGNVAWKTKKILRTRKIFKEMHSNKRERVCLCTLVDSKRKRLTTRLM